MFEIECSETKYLRYINEMISLYFPNYTELSVEYMLSLTITWEGESLEVWARCRNIANSDIFVQQERGHGDNPHELMKSTTERLVKLAVWRVLAQRWPTKASPWGILRGVRPTKLVHRMLDMGMTQQDVMAALVNDYALVPEKAALVTEVGCRQRPFLHDANLRERLISIYIGIPFCPSRCVYCSFPAYSLTQWGEMVAAFLAALETELMAVGNFIRRHGLGVETVYLGGGTPSCLTAAALARLFTLINTQLITPATREFTVEAGRPDSLNEEKLVLMRDYGVTRLCLNPQTLNQTTLERIGRQHTVNDFLEKFKMARTAGFSNINSDLIIGLPGEDLAALVQTLELLLPLSPENITLHTLAVKRASRLKAELDEIALPGNKVTAAMHELAAERLRGAGMIPYYLYRQKNILAHLENVGYAKPGMESVYNIEMMEERQTILGLGGGAATKVVDPVSLQICAIHNPKDIRTYCQESDNLIKTKLKLIEDMHRFQ